MKVRSSQDVDLEEELRGLLQEHGQLVGRAHAGEPFDLVVNSPDGSCVFIQLKTSARGVRDLHAALTQLAIYLKHAADADRGWLIITDSNLTQRRTEEEWKGLLSILAPDVAHKLALAVRTVDGRWASEQALPGVLHDWWEQLEERGSREHGWRRNDEHPMPVRAHEALPSRKFFETWKVLLSAWLSGEGPLQIHEIGERAGAAHPTVSEALRRLEHRGELRRSSDRRAMLRGWPRKSYAELSPLLPTLRKTHWFIDRSGRSADALDLFERFRAKAPANVALGGVEAARTLVPSLDLVGLPRLDLTLHVGGQADLGFVKKLNAVLGPTDGESGALLAVHELIRPVPLFRKRPDGLVLADRAEIALDLSELRLTEQLEEFIQSRLEPTP